MIVFSSKGKASESATIGCFLTKSAGQSVAHNQTSPFVVVTFNQETKDDGFHDNVTNNTRITVPAGKEGWYSIKGTINYAANSSGARTTAIRLNGSTFLQISDAAPLSSGTIHVSCAVDYYLSAGDYVELIAFQNSGVALDALASETVFSAVLIA